ncbi:MAG: alkaline phosphatase family protein [Actinomycetota bacterium]|nr:alkaline phosphatase family protein [Actinomycetota bacterium]
MAADSGSTERLLIIGWDGADWEILDDLMSRGDLPNFAHMLGTGSRADLMSTIPSHSWAAWSTFLTASGPGKHGVYDFVERNPRNPNQRIPVTSSSLKMITFPEMLSRAGHEVRIGNVPVTFPPLVVRGRMISGVTIPPRAPFVHPPEWSNELERVAPFPVNGMEWKRYESHPEALVEEARRFVEERTRSFEVMLEGSWDVAVCVYVAPDRLQHPLGAYLLPSHPSHAEVSDSPLGESIREVFRILDQAIDRLTAVAGSRTTVVVMSDHGFRPINRSANLNKLLGELGFAARSSTAGVTTRVRRVPLAQAVARTRLGRAIKNRIAVPSTVDWSQTRAYQSALGGGISINLSGREPSGVVDPRDFDAVRNDLRASLLGFRDPRTGDNPVQRVLTKEELFSGPYIDLAPDLLVEPSPLWTLSHTDELTSTTEWPSGAHRRKGILVATGPGVGEEDLGERQIADVGATALAFCGLRPPDLDGKVIESLAGQAAAEATPQDLSLHRPTEELSEEDQDHIARHLRDLGYIE